MMAPGIREALNELAALCDETERYGLGYWSRWKDMSGSSEVRRASTLRTLVAAGYAEASKDGPNRQGRWSCRITPAGPIRNKRMLDEGAPDLVIAFPPGPAGTYNMVKQAEERGIRVIRVDWPTPPPDPASRSDGSPSR